MCLLLNLPQKPLLPLCIHLYRLQFVVQFVFCRPRPYISMPLIFVDNSHVCDQRNLLNRAYFILDWFELLNTFQLPHNPNIDCLHFCFTLGALAIVNHRTVWAILLVKRPVFVWARGIPSFLLPFHWVIIFDLSYQVLFTWALCNVCSVALKITQAKLPFVVLDHHFTDTQSGSQFHVFEHLLHQIISFCVACLWYFKVFRAFFTNASLTFNDLGWTEFASQFFCNLWRLLLQFSLLKLFSISLKNLQDLRLPVDIFFSILFTRF